MNDPTHIITIGHGYPAGRGANPSVPTGTLFVWTGELRPPRRCEWYLSGAEIEAWYAHNDISEPFFIARKTQRTSVAVPAASNRIDGLARAWNEFVFARQGLAPGAGMPVVSEQEAYDALKVAVMAVVDAAWDELMKAGSVALSGSDRVVQPVGGYVPPKGARLALVIDGETVTVLEHGLPLVGFDLTTGTIGHWPDGEEWVALGPLRAVIRSIKAARAAKDAGLGDLDEVQEGLACVHCRRSATTMVPLAMFYCGRQLFECVDKTACAAHKPA